MGIKIHVKALDREILRLALPSILANITVPLVGLVDTAVAGHLNAANGSCAEFIGGISVGAMILSVIYWNFAFLRASTGGLTAQAFGRAEMLSSSTDGGVSSECAAILKRALKLSFGFAALLLVAGWPISRLALFFRTATPGVAEFAIQYILIRIWAAPATLSLMALKGWFIGMQDTRSSMYTDLIVNVVNIVASIILTLGIGKWNGIGFHGIALGTVIAQYTGLLTAAVICIRKYRILAVCSEKQDQDTDTRNFFNLNTDLFIRSLCFSGIYLGYTYLASLYGETLLASANIMMNLLMIFSYFTDGFAYAGEALTGRFIGEKDPVMLRSSVRATFRWSFGVAGFWVLIYLIAGPFMLDVMSSDKGLIDTCSRYLPWLLVMPLVGCAAFTWDGIYIGATASKGIRNSMIAALLVFIAVWFAGLVLLRALAGPSGVAPTTAIHLLMAAYFAHLLARSVWLTMRCHKDIYLALQE